MREKKRILILDDPRSLHQSLAPRLRGCGHDVLVTARESILKRLAQEQFDLIITEVAIKPDQGKNVRFYGVDWWKTGLEFIRRLRAGKFTGRGGTDPNVPVIFCSSVVGYPVRDEALNVLGAKAYIEKPFYLETAIVTILDYV